MPDEECVVKHGTTSCELEEVHGGYINFNRQSCLPLDKAAAILSRESKDFDFIPLKGSQATPIQQFDQKAETHL